MCMITRLMYMKTYFMFLNHSHMKIIMSTILTLRFMKYTKTWQNLVFSYHIQHGMDYQQLIKLHETTWLMLTKHLLLVTCLTTKGVHHNILGHALIIIHNHPHNFILHAQHKFMNIILTIWHNFKLLFMNSALLIIIMIQIILLCKKATLYKTTMNPYMCL